MERELVVVADFGGQIGGGSMRSLGPTFRFWNRVDGREKSTFSFFGKIGGRVPPPFNSITKIRRSNRKTNDLKIV